MTIFQIFATCFGLAMMYVISIHAKKRTLGNLEVSFWLTTWASFICIALFPNLLLEMVSILNFSRVFDLLVVLALMVLSVLVFINYFSQREIQRKMVILVRKIALMDNSQIKSYEKK